MVQRAEDITDFLAERQDGRSAVQDDDAWRRRVAGVEAGLFARAQELQRALRAEELASRRATSLAEVALELTAAERLEDLERIVMTRGVRVVGADGGCITVPDGEGSCRLAMHAALGEAATVYSSLPWDSPLPAVRTALTGERLLMPHRAAGLPLTEEMAGVQESADRSAWAVLPMTVGDQLLGSLAISSIDDHVFTDSDLELLEGLAAQCARRSRGCGHGRPSAPPRPAAQRLSETLQRSLLTSPPSPDALRYQPAAQEAQVGG